MHPAEAPEDDQAADGLDRHVGAEADQRGGRRRDAGRERRCGLDRVPREPEEDKGLGPEDEVLASRQWTREDG